MKKLFCLLFVLFSISLVNAGEVVTTPENIVISQPTTNKVDKLRLTFFYSPTGDHRVLIHYNVLSNDGSKIVSSQSVLVRNIPDEPGTDPAQCTETGVPYDCCSGAYPGDPNEGCDESTTDFTDFVSGFGATLKTRADQAMWQDIQKKFTTE